MHGLVDKGETIDIPEDVINDFGKDCFEFVGNVNPKDKEPGNETEPGDKNPPDENTGNEKPKKTNKKKTDTTEE